MSDPHHLTKNKKISPPLFATRLLRWYCKAQLLEDLEGDLNEYFNRNVRSKGIAKAKLIYILDVLKFCRLYTLKSPQPHTVMNHFILYQNYYKTSFRTIKRNKLFSSINIFGLAISMSVGLLLIAFFIEVSSFDDFHLYGDRIFRVNNVLRERNGGTYNYASTSVLTGKEIKESVPGVDRIVEMHKGFDKDITYENKTIPFNGFWASKDFFTVFSFDVISGDPTTALKQPNSIVLTETAAMKVFNSTDVIGKVVQADTVNFTVTAIIKDTPLHSHLHFDMLGSLVSLEEYMLSRPSSEWMKWDNMWDHYVYLLLSEKTDRRVIENNLEKISSTGNKNIQNQKIDLYLEPLPEIALTRNMSNSIGPTVDRSTFTMLGILWLVVILSACFNYTNLSIARALRRIREIGVRKSVGASRSQVFHQFICEAIILALLALILAFIFFLFIRKEFIAMDIRYQEMITLDPTVTMVLCFIGMSVGIGLLAGFIPAAFFSKLNTALILKDSSGITLFKHVNLRKGLIVFQYTLSILFIVLVSIGYRQYRYSLSFDLGFKTENILSIDLQRNNPAPIIKELEAIPEVKEIARTGLVSSVGASNEGTVKYVDPSDSVPIDFNYIDEKYIPLHEHKVIAGVNFNPNVSDETLKSEIIVNEKVLTWMKITDPRDAIGEVLVLDGQEHTVVGVIEDFHHERVNYPIRNFVFRYDQAHFRVLNVKIESTDLMATMNKVDAVWRKIDTVHPLEAKFYKEYIEEAYRKLSWIIKIIGFLAVLAISIASLGLLGMVIFTTETRLKEISIRKVLGASTANLISLMSKGFIFLLVLSALIAIPLGYFFMDRVVFNRLVYRAPIGFLDLFLGTFIIIGVAFLLIGSQTLNVAKSNPADVLRNE